MAPVIENDGMVYSATYSNVPVYELNANGNHVMRRRSDDWINATHILKVADLDKPARTRVLEKEVQLNTHEKVQGGYGKYQGTWVPLDKGLIVAQKYNVYNILKPIFDFVPGDTSPPPAPKHTTAASTKPRVPRAPAQRKVAQPKLPPPRREETYENYDNISEQLHDNDSPDNSTVVSDSIVEEDDYNVMPKKRKRNDMYNETNRQEQEHRIWADQLLDYFMLQDGDPSYAAKNQPHIPDTAHLNRPIDNEGHTALHWACAMGDINVVKQLLDRNALNAARNIRGETPLIRAALFANCYDKGTWSKMVHLLQHIIMVADNHGGTVFHHIAYTAHSGSRAARACSYLQTLLEKLSEMVPQHDAMDFLNSQDRNGDTPFHVATRNSRRCMKLFQGYGLASDIMNNNGETVDQYLLEKASKRARNGNFLFSSSPVQGEATGRFVDDTLPSKFQPSTITLPPQALKTSASQNFTRSLSSIMSTHLSSFLQAGDTELTDMDTLLADTEGAYERITKEISTVRQKSFALAATLEADGEDLSTLVAQHSAVKAKALALEEQVQQRLLHDRLHREENVRDTLHPKEIKDKKAELAKRERLAVQLHEAQEKRKRLVEEKLAAAADASMGEAGKQLKGAVARVLGYGEEDLMDVIDEVLENMEMSKADGDEMATG